MTGRRGPERRGAALTATRGAGRGAGRTTARWMGRGLLGAAAAAGAIAAAARVGALRRVVVEGTSMTPDLLPGDRLVLVRGLTPRTGHVVGALDPRGREQMVVKRVAHVTPQHVVLRGDNPEGSTDSRTFGPVPRALVRGVAVYRYAPAHRRGRVPSDPGRLRGWSSWQ